MSQWTEFKGDGKSAVKKKLRKWEVSPFDLTVHNGSLHMSFPTSILGTQAPAPPDTCVTNVDHWSLMYGISSYALAGARPDALFDFPVPTPWPLVLACGAGEDFACQVGTDTPHVSVGWAGSVTFAPWVGCPCEPQPAPLKNPFKGHALDGLASKDPDLFKNDEVFFTDGGEPTARPLSKRVEHL